MGVVRSLSPMETMRRHPCFSEEAHEVVGRIHLPVARRCNIRCAFCERRICAHLTLQHPGWAARLLPPAEAVALVREVVSTHAWQTQRDPASIPLVVGVAGPGEPLANPETFQALAAVHAAYPTLLKCVSTNGLMLEEALPQLLAAGVAALTVTVNASCGEVGEHIYAWVRYRGRVYQGREAAEILIDRQLRGIQAALAAGLTLKVNTVLIPGVNDRDVACLARCLRTLGVGLMNLMPLIPGGQMGDRRPPTCDELRQARRECEQAIPQFRRCEQCRADAVRLPRPSASAGR